MVWHAVSDNDIGKRIVERMSPNCGDNTEITRATRVFTLILVKFCRAFTFACRFQSVCNVGCCHRCYHGLGLDFVQSFFVPLQTMYTMIAPCHFFPFALSDLPALRVSRKLKCQCNDFKASLKSKTKENQKDCVCVRGNNEKWIRMS